ncbi:hypothetical protein D3C75_323880 [compost metagenome]
MAEMSDFGPSQLLLLLLFFLMVYISQGYSLYLYVCIFFRKKTGIKNILMLISGLLLIKAFLGSYITVTEKILLSILIHFIVLAFCFYGKQAEKLFAAVFYTVFTASIEMIIIFVSGLLKPVINGGIVNVVQMGVVLLCTLILVRMLFVFRSSSLITLSSRDWLVLSVIPVCSLVILIAALAGEAGKMSIEDIKVSGHAVMVMLGLLTVNIAVLYVYRKLLYYINQMARNEVIEKQILEYEKLQQKQQELQYLRHDMKNILVTVRGLLSGQPLQDASQYLDTVIEAAFTVSGVSTGHAVLDAICNEKIGFAEKQGIEVHRKILIPQDLVLDGMEVGLSLIIGNMLDNALEGVMRLGKGQERWIDLQIRYYNNTLLIRVINTADKVSISNSGDYHSSKRAGSVKGSGVDIIKMYVQKLDGTVNLDYTYPHFKVSVLLNVG